MHAEYVFTATCLASLMWEYAKSADAAMYGGIDGVEPGRGLLLETPPGSFKSHLGEASLSFACEWADNLGA